MCGLQSWTGESSSRPISRCSEGVLVASLELNLHQHILSDLAACDSCPFVEVASHPLISRVHTLNNASGPKGKASEGATQQEEERVYMVCRILSSF